jgi:ligand-binding sensor domain-containing protein
MQLLHPFHPLIVASLIAAMSTGSLGQDSNHNTIQLQESATTKLSRAMGELVAELDSTIFYILQDRNDDYWFGSDGQGVFHLVGKKLTRYSTKDGLCNDRIRGIEEDASGIVFFRTLGGISRFDGESFSTLAVAKTSNDLNEWQSKPSDLWFNSAQDENGVFRYDGKSLYHLEFPKHPMADDFYAQRPIPPYNPYQVYCVYRDSKGNIWFGTSTFGVCRYDGKDLSWMYEEHLSHIGRDRSFGIRSIIEDTNGDFWFCNTRYRYKIDPGNTTKDGTNWINYRRENGVGLTNVDRNDEYPYFMSVIKGDNGDLWMATHNKGVFRYDGERLSHYPVKDGLKDISLFSIYKDKQGGMWLGTHLGGAYKFNGTSFERFSP